LSPAPTGPPVVDELIGKPQSALTYGASIAHCALLMRCQRARMQSAF
jgi:hypothetical protein